MKQAKKSAPCHYLAEYWSRKKCICWPVKFEFWLVHYSHQYHHSYIWHHFSSVSWFWLMSQRMWPQILIFFLCGLFCIWISSSNYFINSLINNIKFESPVRLDFLVAIQVFYSPVNGTCLGVNCLSTGILFQYMIGWIGCPLAPNVFGLLQTAASIQWPSLSLLSPSLPSITMQNFFSLLLTSMPSLRSWWPSASILSSGRLVLSFEGLCIFLASL